MPVRASSLEEVLGPERFLSAAEVAPLFGLRPTKAELARFDEVCGVLAQGLKKAKIGPALAVELKLVGFPVFGRVRVTTKEEPATFRAIASRFPTWFTPDLLTSETMKRDRAWNGLPALDAVVIVSLEPVATGKTFAESMRVLGQRSKKVGLSLAPPALPALAAGLVAIRELRGELPTSRTAGRTDTWARSLGREHRFTVAWSSDSDGSTEIAVGTTIDEDRSSKVGTLGAHLVPLGNAD